MEQWFPETDLSKFVADAQGLTVKLQEAELENALLRSALGKIESYEDLVRRGLITTGAAVMSMANIARDAL